MIYPQMGCQLPDILLGIDIDYVLVSVVEKRNTQTAFRSKVLFSIAICNFLAAIHWWWANLA